MPTERAAAFLERFVRWAEGRSDLAGALLVGSQARDDHPADPWSDVDLVLIADDPAPYLADGSWLSELGRPLATFVEPTLAGQRERRVLFDAGRCDGHLKRLLLVVLGWHARATSGADTWHGARFIEQWLDPALQARLPATFAGYDPERLPGALWATAELFRDVTRQLAAQLHLAYAEEVDGRISEMVRETLRP